MKEEYIQANLYKQLSAKERKNYILSIDFTEMRIKNRKVYTCGIVAVNEKILCAELVDCKNDSEAACRTVEMAIANYGVPYMILSDRGSPFVSKSFQNLMRKYGIQHSMSRPGTPGDNCYIETFWKTMKTELGDVSSMTIETYKMVMAYYAYYYNTERPHSTLWYSTPLERYSQKNCH